MSEQQFSNDSFMNYFLTEFTKEIIRNTKHYATFVTQEEIKGTVHKKEAVEKIQVKQVEKQIEAQRPLPKKTVQEIVKEKRERDKEQVQQLRRNPTESPFKTFFEQRARTQRTVAQIPHTLGTSLPATVQDIRPVPTNLEVDLKKLNPLLRDPLVRMIECNGPGEKVIVMGAMGRKNTATILTKDEIDEVIQAFSTATRIPIHEGVSKVVFGKLILSAMVSDVIGSKFTIKKMSNPMPYQPY